MIFSSDFPIIHDDVSEVNVRMQNIPNDVSMIGLLDELKSKLGCIACKLIPEARHLCNHGS